MWLLDTHGAAREGGDEHDGQEHLPAAVDVVLKVSLSLGVSLLLLSGKMTQAPPPTFPHQENEDTVQTSIGLEEEPASKRIKWEVEEEVDLLDDEQYSVMGVDDDESYDDLLP